MLPAILTAAPGCNTWQFKISRLEASSVSRWRPSSLQLLHLNHSNDFLVWVVHIYSRSWRCKSTPCVFIFSWSSLHFADDHHKFEGGSFVCKKKNVIITRNNNKQWCRRHCWFIIILFSPPSHLPDALQLIKVGRQAEFGEMSGTATCRRTVRKLLRGLTGDCISGKSRPTKAACFQYDLHYLLTASFFLFFSTLPPP